jgi:8-oxo-dGTP pyrophosphatase MutT (NUDIX family)
VVHPPFDAGDPPKASANMPEIETRAETCAGGVVFRRTGGRIEVALGEQRDRLTGSDNTRLPKGHVEPGETPEETAVREVREEIGVAAEIVASLGSVNYTFVEEGIAVAKEVHFFLMEIASGEQSPLDGALDGEMERTYWCPIEHAPARLTFETERRIAERARSALKSRPGR